MRFQLKLNFGLIRFLNRVRFQEIAQIEPNSASKTDAVSAKDQFWPDSVFKSDAVSENIPILA